MTAQDLIDALRAAGYKPAPYSGRGMEGRQCVGVHVEDVGDLVPLGAALAALKPEAPCTDGGGRGMLAVYWRNVPWPKALKVMRPSRSDTEKAVDDLIRLVKLATRRDVDASAHGTRQDWDRAEAADEAVDQARDALLKLVGGES